MTERTDKKNIIFDEITIRQMLDVDNTGLQNLMAACRIQFTKTESMTMPARIGITGIELDQLVFKQKEMRKEKL